MSHETTEDELNYEDYDEGSFESSVNFHECGSEPDLEPEAVPGSLLSSQEARPRSMKAEIEKLKEEEKALRLRYKKR